MRFGFVFLSTVGHLKKQDKAVGSWNLASLQSPFPSNRKSTMKCIIAVLSGQALAVRIYIVELRFIAAQEEEIRTKSRSR